MIPDGGLTFQPPITVLNMSGGVSCLTSGNNTCWLMLPKRSTFWTQLDATPQWVLDHITPLRILTKSYFQSADELHDPIPDSALYLPTSRPDISDVTQFRRWFGLSTAFAAQEKHTTALRAERIGKQILFCRDTLFALQRSYLFAMDHTFQEENISYPEDGNVHFMLNKYATDIGYRTHTCLNELQGLRDFLLYYIFEDMYLKNIGIVDGLKMIQANDKFNFGSLLSHMFSNGDPMGPIALMSLYRNVFFHFTGTSNNPLGQAYCFRETESMFGRVPYLIYPLHDDLARLKAIERRAPLGEGTKHDRQKEAERFMKLSNYRDGLEFCYDSFLALLLLSSAIERKVDLASETVTLTDSDILQATVRNSDGTVHHYAKGPDGKLVEGS